MEERKGFGSNFGFLMAAIGSAVGLGNIWGFPNKMGANGGFTFLIIYLILAALIHYPIYVTPSGWPCEAEDLVQALIAARDQPTPKAPRGQVQRWAAGILASLDRRPPPSY